MCDETDDYEDVPHAYAQAFEGEMVVAYAYTHAQAVAALREAGLPDGRVRNMGDRTSIVYTHPEHGNVEAECVVSREDALILGPPHTPPD